MDINNVIAGVFFDSSIRLNSNTEDSEGIGVQKFDLNQIDSDHPEESFAFENGMILDERSLYVLNNGPTFVLLKSKNDYITLNSSNMGIKMQSQLLYELGFLSESAYVLDHQKSSYDGNAELKVDGTENTFSLVLADSANVNDIITFKSANSQLPLYYTFEKHENDWKVKILLEKPVNKPVNKPPFIKEHFPDLQCHFIQVGKITLDPYFTDDDNLTYEAISSDSEVVEVQIINGNLNYTTRKPGTAQITITATDTLGQSVSQIMNFIVSE